MKLIQQLLEMAKSSSKRKSQAKQRRKKKAQNPTLDTAGNPIKRAMDERGGSGQGAHPTSKDKANTSRGRRQADKRALKDY